MAGSLHILSAGVTSPVGLTLAANDAAFRAGLNAFTRPAHFRDKRCGDAIAVSALESLNEPSAAGRVRKLAEKAAQEAFWPFREQRALRVGVLFAAGEDRPGLSRDAVGTVCRALIENLPFAIEKHCCSLQLAGSAGTMLLLETAQDLIAKGEVDFCLVGGADSYLHIESLHWLEDCGRLKSAEHPNGVIPGEAAGFLVVTNRDLARRLQLQSIAEISGIAATTEPRPWFQRQATHGQGLTQAVSRTFASATVSQADAVFAELNGEPWRADEWGYAYLRSAKCLKSPLRTLHPSSSLGETGAASTPVALALAAASLHRTHQGAEAILVWAASATSGLRGSCLLRKVEIT